MVVAPGALVEYLTPYFDPMRRIIEVRWRRRGSRFECSREHPVDCSACGALMVLAAEFGGSPEFCPVCEPIDEDSDCGVTVFDLDECLVVAA